MANLLQIGSSGVLGHQNMLNTTGNNISNVSTDGYSRQRTDNKSQTHDMGLGRASNNRQINKFAQAEVVLDTSASSNRDKFLSEITRTDQVLSDDSNNLDDGISTLFESLHTTNDDPTSLSNRQLALNDAKTLVNSFRSVGKQLHSQVRTANSEIGEKPGVLNSLIKQIDGFNKQIMISENTAKGVNGALLDQRDVAIKALASEIDISTIDNDNGTVSINLITGQPLIMQSSVTQFKSLPGNPHTDKTEFVLQIDKNEIPLQDTDLGGAVGALFEFRDEAVYPALREIGQLSLGMADALNIQNRMGLNLDGEMGKDIYVTPSTVAKSYLSNSSTEHMVTASLIPNEGSELTTSEYEVEMTSANTFDVYEIKNGVKGDPLAISGNFPGPVELDEHGFSLDFTAAPIGFQTGDKFMISPTLFNLDDFDIAITRPEDLALSSALRTSRGVNNVTISELKVTEITNADLSFSNDKLNTTAPQNITVNASGDYDIFDGSGVRLATTSGSLYGFDLFANAVPPLDPGFEVKIEGRPNPGETFNLSFNEDAIADNSNGLKLAGLENVDKLRRNHKKNGENQMTFAEGVSTLISNVGNQTRTARVDAAAAASKLIQSEEWVSSVSGVNLDEEAANMVRYEQAYNASAQVVSISKEIFDTILNAGR